MNERNGAPPVSGCGMLLWFRCLLSLAAVLTGYLAWVSLTRTSVIGCGPQSGCAEVLQSRWAYWFGIPVSLPAFLLYGLLLIATFGMGSRGDTRGRTVASAVLVAGATMVAGGAIWFVVLMVRLGGFCPFCLAAHTCGLAFAFSVFGAAGFRRPREPEDEAGARSPSSQLLWASAGAGLLGVGALAVGQLLNRAAPDSFAVESVASTNTIGAPTAVARTLSLHDGQFVLKLDETPIIGSVAAPHVVVSLFDYTCRHCRRLHGLLMEAYRSYSNQVAIAAMPVPLEASCNRLIKKTRADHLHACAYTKLALALWRIDRAAFRRFDSWIFGQPKLPGIEEARRKAFESVSAERLTFALADPWITNQIDLATDIYEENYKRTRRGQLPQVLIGSVVFVGVGRQARDIQAVMERELGLRKAVGAGGVPVPTSGSVPERTAEGRLP